MTDPQFSKTYSINLSSQVWAGKLKLLSLSKIINEMKRSAVYLYITIIRERERNTMRQDITEAKA